MLDFFYYGLSGLTSRKTILDCGDPVGILGHIHQGSCLRTKKKIRWLPNTGWLSLNGKEKLRKGTVQKIPIN